MNKRIKAIAILIVLIIGLTACSGLADEAQDLPSNEQVTLPAGQTGQPQLDLVSAAKELGITEEELRTALGPPQQGAPPDFAAVASELGVTQQELMDALGAPTGAPPNSPQPTSQGQPSGVQSSPQAPNTLSMFTMTIMIIITFIMQAGLVLFSMIVIKSYRGVREAAAATFLMAFGFLTMLIGNSNQLSTANTGFVFNLFVISGFLLFYLAICRFTEMPFNRWIVLVFAPLGYLALTVSWFFKLHSIPMLLVAAVLTFVFNIASAWRLYRNKNRRYRLASYLTALPLFIYGLFAIGRIIIGHFRPDVILTGASTSAITEIIALFIFSYLWSSGFVLMFSQRLQSDLNDLAMNDALTRIRNRRAMQDMLDFEMRRIEEEIREFSIVLMDVDHFKKVNDTYGHDIGDVVLQWLASTVNQQLRTQDVIARWGGEEFLILFPDTTLDEAMAIAERLRSVIDTSSIETDAGALHITFSGGVASSQSTRNVGELCKIADQALYIAKETRNKVVSQEDIPAEPV